MIRDPIETTISPREMADAYEDGLMAAMLGLDTNENPFPPDDPRHHEWLDGYHGGAYRA